MAASNRIVKKLPKPGRPRLSTLRVDFAACKVERNRFSTRLWPSAPPRWRRPRPPTGDGRRGSEARRDQTRSLSLAAIRNVLRDFDHRYPHFTAGEWRDLLHEIIDEVCMFPDHIEVALLDGIHAAARSEQAHAGCAAWRGGGSNGKRANGTPAGGSTRFTWRFTA